MPFKKPTAYFTTRETRRTFDRISKAAWADLYADLYRQTHGEEATEEIIIEDAEKRLETLQRNRIR